MSLCAGGLVLDEAGPTRTEGYASRPMAAAPTDGPTQAGSAALPPSHSTASTSAGVPAEWLARLRAAWEGELSPSFRRVVLALLTLAFVGSALLARLGTPRARFGAAAILAVIIAGAIARSVLGYVRRGDTRRIIAGTVGRTDPALGAATLRALTLVNRTAQDRDQRARRPSPRCTCEGSWIGRRSIGSRRARRGSRSGGPPRAASSSRRPRSASWWPILSGSSRASTCSRRGAARLRSRSFGSRTSR